MSWADFYDVVRIVSLPTRHDRRRDMRDELVRTAVISFDHDLSDALNRVAFFDAFRADDAGLFRSAGSHGCFLSHLAILEDAARAGHSVVILQDDCDFTAGAAVLTAPPACDIFYGGYELEGPRDRPHDCHVIGAHCMGFSAEAARRAALYLRSLLDPATPADPLAATTEPDFNPRRRPPIDGSLVWFRRAHPDLVTVFHKISEQRSSRTDIGNQRLFDKVPVFRQAAALARKANRARERRAYA